MSKTFHNPVEEVEFLRHEIKLLTNKLYESQAYGEAINDEVHRLKEELQSMKGRNDA